MAVDLSLLFLLPSDRREAGLPNHLLVASNCNHLILSDGQICSIETEKETTETPFDA
jgi:hypothetical protein